MDTDETMEAAEESMGRCGIKHPDIAESLRKGLLLLTFFDFPAGHRKSIRSTNNIESMFSGVNHRARQARQCTGEATIPDPTEGGSRLALRSHSEPRD